MDAVCVYRYDRFARSLRQLVNALEEFRALGIDFVSLHEGVDTSTPNGRLIFGIFASIAEFERELIRDRVRSGIAAARAKGKRLGRPRVVVDAASIAALRSAGRSWSDLLMWEGLYIGQFVALEFFFRGFLVGGLGRYMGIFSVPVSVMPYMMIHFTKLLPEAAASVVAGFVLGYLAWETKSIWGGVCIHCAVAATMDLLALAHKSQLPWLHS